MVEDVLLNARLTDGQRLVQGLQRGGVNVVVAGWVLTAENGWRLYVSADYPEPNGWGEAHRVLYGTRDFDRLAFGSSDVRLVRKKDPVTDELLAVRKHGRPGRIARAKVDRIDGRAARRVYVYPAVQLLSPIEVVRTIDELATGPNPAKLLAVTFRDGRTIVATPVSTSLQFTNGAASATVTLREPADGQERSYPATDIAEVGLPDAAA